MSTSNDLPEGAHLASAFVLLALCTTLLWPDAADARRAIRVDPGDGQWEQGGDAGNGAPQSLPFAFTILGARVDTVCIGNDGVATFGWGTCAPFSGSAADVAANGLGSIGTAVIAPLISHAAAAGISRSVQFDWGGVTRLLDPGSGDPVPGNESARVGTYSSPQGSLFRLFADASFRITWTTSELGNPADRNRFQMVVWQIRRPESTFGLDVGDVVVEFNYESVTWGDDVGIYAGLAGPDGTQLVGNGPLFLGDGFLTGCEVGPTPGNCTWSAPNDEELIGVLSDSSDTADDSEPVAGRHVLFLRAPDADADGVPDVADNCVAAANGGPYDGIIGRYNQFDSDDDGIGVQCDADFINDGFVNFADLARFRAGFGTTNANLDLNRSGGIVNFADLAVFRSLLGAAPGPNSLAGAQIGWDFFQAGTPEGGFVYSDQPVDLRYLSGSYGNEFIYATAIRWVSDIQGEIQNYQLVSPCGTVVEDGWSTQSITCSTTLQPGTHHITMIVDYVWRSQATRFATLEVRTR